MEKPKKEKRKKREKKYKNCEVHDKKQRGTQAGKIRFQSILIALIVTVIIMAVTFYFTLFAINVRAVGFWAALIAAVVIFLIVKAVSYLVLCEIKGGVGTAEKEYQNYRNGKLFLIPAVIVGVLILIAIGGSTMFHAGKYASIMTVEDSVFKEDLAETLNTDSIALMDTYSAQMLGDREIGSLSSVVSQYDVSGDYTQIDYNGKPLKVAPLEYAGFFKWINNRSQGIPGYVTVDPVSMSADYKEASQGMKYVPSAYLGQDLARHIRMRYPTAMFGNLHFEIDEKGTPYYVASVYTKKVMLFGGTTVKGAIIVNPADGSSQYYDAADVPRWVDVVFDGDLLCQQYNWYGKLQNGFINSVIGKKGCKRVTMYSASEEEEDSGDAVPLNDYGYVAKDGDIWIYTGITSVNGDSSNIGFIMANERTGETHYYEVAGADEKSAMSAAEGEVQEKRYQASFPSLINVDGEPTYIMVLKDASGLVKLYAAVNVEQYNLVTTGDTQEECLQIYRKLLGGGETDPDSQSGVNENAEEQSRPLQAEGEKNITISDIKYIDIDGNTYVYIITKENEIYRQKVSENEELLFLEPGDKITVSYNGKEMISFQENNR